jgi:hypothetical protein
MFAGCRSSSTHTSSQRIPPLSVEHAVALAEQYYNRCGDQNIIGQCGIISPFAAGENSVVANGMAKYVRIVRKPDRFGAIATPLGARYAMLDVFAGQDVPIPSGMPVARAVWRVDDVGLWPCKFTQHNENARLDGIIVLAPTPLQAVMLRQHSDLPAAQHEHAAQGQRVTLHFRYDADLNGMHWWLVVRDGSEISFEK